jgi:hypothetical protein
MVRICQACGREMNWPFCPYCSEPTIDRGGGRKRHIGSILSRICLLLGSFALVATLVAILVAFKSSRGGGQSLGLPSFSPTFDRDMLLAGGFLLLAVVLWVTGLVLRYEARRRNRGE